MVGLFVSCTTNKDTGASSALAWVLEHLFEEGITDNEINIAEHVFQSLEWYAKKVAESYE